MNTAAELGQYFGENTHSKKFHQRFNGGLSP